MQAETLVSAISLTERQLEQFVILDVETIQGDDFFEQFGHWVLQSVSYLQTECMGKQVIPEIHLETLTMPRDEFNKILVESFLDELGVRH